MFMYASSLFVVFSLLRSIFVFFLVDGHMTVLVSALPCMRALLHVQYSTLTSYQVQCNRSLSALSVGFPGLLALVCRSCSGMLGSPQLLSSRGLLHP